MYSGIMMVEQSVNEGADVAGRGYGLDQGTVQLEGSPAELRDDEEISRLYLGG